MLFTVFSSCGNGEGDKLPVVANDSLPADIAAINQKINADRNNPDLYFERAKAHFSHNDFENTLTDMNIVLKIDSTKPDYYLFLSDIYFTQNQTRETRSYLRKAIALDSTNSEALMKYSQLFYLLRKYDTATIYINRSLHFNNASPVAHFQKGMILKEWGDTAAAMASFQSAVEFNQKYYDAYMQLGLLSSQKKSPLAAGYFDNAINLKPRSIEAYYGKAMFFQNTEDFENALNVYEEILKLSPEHQDATFNTGIILFAQKKYDEALEKFELTIKRDLNFFRGYYGMGICHSVLGQKQKAIEEFKKCLALNPEFVPASQELDLVAGKGGRK